MIRIALHPINRVFATVFSALLLLSSAVHAEVAWWNKEWPIRQKINLDLSESGASVKDATILLRLSDSNFQFASAREDGSDIRIVSADGKTVIDHDVESYDGLLNEAYIWLKLPERGADDKSELFIYYGNQSPSMPSAGQASAAFGSDVVANYHFSQRGTPPADSSSNKNNATAAATVAQGSIIGTGLSLLGNMPLTISESDSLKWGANQSLAISLWIKPVSLQPNAIIMSRSDGNASFKLLLDQGMPMIDIKAGAGIRSAGGAPLAVGVWSHLAVVAGDNALKIYVNGEPYASLAGALPAIHSPIILGGEQAETKEAVGLIGDLDELRILNTSMTPEAVRFLYLSQGTSEASLRLMSLGEVEGGGSEGSSKFFEHIMLFGDIANNMMFDGWMAVGVCVIMIVIGWTVAIKKFFYLNKIEKGNKEFMRVWKAVANDLTALDNADNTAIASMGGSADEEDQELMRDSPLFHIYHIGSEEINHRVHKLGLKKDGLSGRSIQAIKASLDTGLVHENHRLTDGLVYLTISIAGGPYVGLLGTVVGVMITFAIIARSGEVNVNSIAPGIASALLATVVGLIVAIPALFIYSYLNGRIKTVVSTMEVFIDEFVAKMAEFYRPTNEKSSGENNN